jgi:uncharacterized protein
MTIESPCVGICELDKTGDHCVGCYRTLAEIAQWSRLTDDEKIRILAALEQRRKLQTEQTNGIK